jgi:hydroxymethylpyrimidine/phosphomethylpyrimidine kinase
LLADAEAVWNAGGRPLAVPTAWTSQTRRGVRGVELPGREAVLDQIEALFDDEAPDAVKLGMLGGASLAKALASLLKRRLGDKPLVVDPVLRASSGAVLFHGDPRAYDGLFKLATAVTPNLSEAAAFLDWGANVKWDRVAMVEAARHLLSLGPKAVVLKGGHLGGERADDLLLDETGERWFGARRLRRRGRGTGCRFAAAIASRLARQETLPAAISFAKKLVRRSLLASGSGA